MALVTLTEIKQFLSINSTDKDDSINALANYVSATVESYCGREFDSQDVTEFHDGGRSSVFVDRLPINNINTVYHYDGNQYVALTGPMNTSTGELPNTIANASSSPDYVVNNETG